MKTAKTSIVSVLILAFCCLSLPVQAASSPNTGPGNYSLKVKVGPSFELQDFQNQFRIGGEFDYDLGYGFGLGLLSLFGASKDIFRFQLMPTLRYDFLYLGPTAFYGVTGIGYGNVDGDNTLDVRAGVGVNLPLGEKYEVGSDINLFFTPAGTPGTPVTFDWLINFGVKFK